MYTSAPDFFISFFAPNAVLTHGAGRFRRPAHHSLFFVIRESKDEGKFHLTGVGTDGDVISCSDNRVHHFFVGRNINGVLADQRCRNVVTCILINFQSGTGECCKILKDKGNL